MIKKNIISTALAVASFAGVAVAGTPAPVATYKPAPAPCEKRLSGALSVGYSSNYDYRGLVPRSSTGGNMTPISLDLDYKLNENWNLYTGLDYKAIWDKSYDANNNEFGLEVGAKTQRWLEGLTISPNYKLTHGGIMGQFIKDGRGKAHSVFQSFGVGLLYDLSAVGAKGFFVGASADYIFQGATGWWFQGVTGYEAKFNEKLSAIISAEYNATSGFYGGWSEPASDGDMSYGLKLQLPYKLCKNVILSPFVGTWWTGHSGNNIVLSGGKTMRNFTVVAGANLTWTF